MWQNGKKKPQSANLSGDSLTNLRPFLTPSPYSQHSQLSFSGDDIQLQDFPNSKNKYEPLDYDAPNEPSSLLVFTNDSDYMSPHYFSPNNNTHLDNPRRSRPSLVVSNYLSPAIPSSPLLTFHPSHRLSVNFSQTGIPYLFPKSQRPKSNLSSTSYIR